LLAPDRRAVRAVRWHPDLLDFVKNPPREDRLRADAWQRRRVRRPIN